MSEPHSSDKSLKPDRDSPPSVQFTPPTGGEAVRERILRGRHFIGLFPPDSDRNWQPQIDEAWQAWRDELPEDQAPPKRPEVGADRQKALDALDMLLRRLNCLCPPKPNQNASPRHSKTILSANPFLQLADFAFQVCEEERHRDCSPNRLRRSRGEMQRHNAQREMELQRLRFDALAAARKTTFTQQEVEQRVVAICDQCVKLLLWERDAPRLTAEQWRERELSACWNNDPPGEYLIGLINEFRPLWERVQDLGAAYEGGARERSPLDGKAAENEAEGTGAGHDPAEDEQAKENGEWFTVSEAARASGCTKAQISGAVRDGQLKSNGKKGRDRRIDAADLARWQLRRANREGAVESDATVERKLRRAQVK